MSEKILSQYPHVRDCPSLPPLIQRNKIRPAYHFFTPGKVLKYIVHFHRESFFIYEILSPLFALDLPQPQTKLKLSSSTKVTSLKKRERLSSRFFFVQESLKAALKQAEARLEEDKTAVKAQKRETKV